MLHELNQLHSRLLPIILVLVLGTAAGCEKPRTAAKADPPLPPPQIEPPPNLRTSKSDEEVLAGFPERDQNIYYAQRRNSKSPVHAALVAVLYQYQNANQHQEAARVLRRMTELFPDFLYGWT